MTIWAAAAILATDILVRCSGAHAPGHDIAPMLVQVNATEVYSYQTVPWHWLRVPMGYEAAATALQGFPGVDRVAPNESLELDLWPNDPLLNQNPSAAASWGLQRLDLPCAWEERTGSRQVLVGLLDTGVDLSHPDLQGNLYVNGAEPINGLDDDGDGYVDDRFGWDFCASRFCATEGNDPSDPYIGHGTHVAGEIGAVGNNGTGLVGANWAVTILPLSLWWSDASCAMATNAGGAGAARAVELGLTKGARIFNASWHSGGQDPNIPCEVLLPVFHEVVDSNDLLLVAAAGNLHNANIDDPPISLCPARDTSNHVLTVAASGFAWDGVDPLGNRPAGFSNWGTVSVDIVAPGDFITGLWPVGGAVCSDPDPDGYAVKSGTSMSAPYAAGVAALVWGTNPDLTAVQVRDILMQSGRYYPQYDPASANPTVTGRHVDACEALRMTPPPSGGPPPEPPGRRNGKAWGKGGRP